MSADALPTPALPPLPEARAWEDVGSNRCARKRPVHWHAPSPLFTAEQMQDYARAALSSHQAATDKESLTVAPVVALGGEKGEAGLMCPGCLGSGEGGLVNNWGHDEQAVCSICKGSGEVGAPASKARMLTREEIAECCGGCRTNSAIETWIERGIARFCVENGIPLPTKGGA